MSTLTMSRRDRRAKALAEIAAEVRRLVGEHAAVIHDGPKSVCVALDLDNSEDDGCGSIVEVFPGNGTAGEQLYWGCRRMSDYYSHIAAKVAARLDMDKIEARVAAERAGNHKLVKRLDAEWKAERLPAKPASMESEAAHA